MRLRKLGSGLTALALCFLLTGFLGGGKSTAADSGEKPQDCITAIIKALENNDSKAFKERVPLDFWFTFGLFFHDEYREHMNKASSGKMDFMKDFAPGKETEANWRFKRIAQNYFEERLDTVINNGSTAMDAQFSMWTPEELSKVKASEAGTGEEADTATAVFEVKGQKVTLGLAKINDKWVLLSAAGNKKGALDAIALLKKHWQGVAAQEQEKLEAEKKQAEQQAEREAALNTCIEEILNIVQITPKQVIVEQDGKFLYVKIQAELLNTGTKLCNIGNVQMIFADKNGKIIFQQKTSVKTSVKLDGLLQPNRRVRMDMSEFVGASSMNSSDNSFRIGDNELLMYSLQQVKKGEATLSIRPDEISFEKTTYQDLLGKIRENADGTWQLDDFPAVKPRPVADASMSKEDRDALETFLKKKLAEEAVKLAQDRENHLKQYKIEHNPAEKRVTIHNPLSQEVDVEALLLEAFENGVLVNTNYERIANVEIKPKSSKTFGYDYQAELPAGRTLKPSLSAIAVGPYDQRMEVNATNQPQLIAGVVPPLLYQDSPVLFTLTAEQLGTAPAEATTAPQAEGATPAAPTEAPKAEAPAEPVAEAPKAEAAKTDAPKAETPAVAPETDATKTETPKAEAPKAETPTQGVTASGTATAAPTPPEGKNSGKAVLGTITLDLVGLTTFGPDGKPDSAIRVSVQNPSPLVAVRIDNIGGTMASWKTSGVKTSAKGVIAVVQDGKQLNAGNTAFSLDVTKPVVLDLLVQDTGVIAEGKTRLRAVFHHQDGKRSYAILEPEKK